MHLKFRWIKFNESTKMWISLLRRRRGRTKAKKTTPTLKQFERFRVQHIFFAAKKSICFSAVCRAFGFRQRANHQQPSPHPIFHARAIKEKWKIFNSMEFQLYTKTRFSYRIKHLRHAKSSDCNEINVQRPLVQKQTHAGQNDSSDQICIWSRWSVRSNYFIICCANMGIGHVHRRVTSQIQTRE